MSASWFGTNTLPVWCKVGTRELFSMFRLPLTGRTGLIIAAAINNPRLLKLVESEILCFVRFTRHQVASLESILESEFACNTLARGSWEKTFILSHNSLGSEPSLGVGCEFMTCQCGLGGCLITYMLQRYHRCPELRHRPLHRTAHEGLCLIRKHRSTLRKCHSPLNGPTGEISVPEVSAF